jgi:hypothetical protein
VFGNPTLKVVRHAGVESARAAGHDVNVRGLHAASVAFSTGGTRREKQIPRADKKRRPSE